MARLSPFFTVIEGINSDQRVALNEFPFTIGRANDCHLVVDRDEISRMHARFDVEFEQVHVTDLGSRNGTFVNGERLPHGEARRLRAGDEVALGSVLRLYFEDPGTTSQIPVYGSVPEMGIHVDEGSAQTYVNGLRLDPPLSPGQFSLLCLMLHSSGRIITRDEIREYVWGPGELVSDETLDALISRLRKRLNQADQSHEYIMTRRGFGLMFRNLR